MKFGFDKIKYIAFASVSVLAGVLLAFVVFKGILFLGELKNSSHGKTSTDWLTAMIFSVTKGEEEKIEIPNGHLAIYINLDKGTLTAKDDQIIVSKFNISHIGGKETLWEPINGQYTVGKKSPTYKSRLGIASWADALVADPNIIIHNYQEGHPVSVGLKEDDAKTLFGMISVGDQIFVSGGREQKELLPLEKSLLGFDKPSVLSGKEMPAVGAEAFLVVDMETEEVLMSKRADEPFPMASISKWFVAWLSDFNYSIKDKIFFDQESINTYGNQGNFRTGDEVIFEDVLYALLMESSNDAGEALARQKNRDEFLKELNNQIRKLGLQKTFLEDASGLSSKNVSSANDLYKFLKLLYEENQDILEISNTRRHTGSNENSRPMSWASNNRFVSQGDIRILGAKNGYTGEAGQTFAGILSFPISELNKRDIAVIILKSFNRNKDIENIMAVIEKNIVYNTGLTETEVLQKRIAQRDSDIVSTIPKENLISLIAVGDIMLDRGVKNVVYSHGKGDYSFMFADSFFLKDADITIGNLEGPVSSQGYDLGSVFSFRMEPKSLVALKSAGFDVLSIANNHMGDWGMTAFEDTMKEISKSGLLYVGSGLNKKEAETIKIVEKNDIKVGFLSFSDVGPKWLAKNENLPFMLQVSEDFSQIISKGASLVDHLIVSIHFGEEYSKQPTERQISLAKTAIDYGARVVLGHHPHVVLPTEFYKDGFIAYSMGNFIFDQNFSKETSFGQVLKLDFNKKSIVDIREAIVDFNKIFQPTLRQ